MRTKLMLVATLVFTLLAMVVVAPPHRTYAASTVTNGTFGSTTTGTPAGWSTSGTASADFTEAGGRSGMRLTHYSASAYTVTTFQTLTGLTNGVYTLRAWIKTDGGQNMAAITLAGCGGPNQSTSLPITKGYTTWVQIAVSTTVTGGQCTVGLYSDANAGNYASFDDVTFTPGGAALPVLGGDLSGVTKNEAFGGTYYDENSVQGDPLQILKNHGMNYVRLKVWVNPADGYNNKATVLAMATRAKALGMKLLVDFHYSDIWADPGHQDKPAAWQSYSFAQLQQAVYDHSYDVVSALVAQGTTPDMVQVGNEINDGMLWQTGRISSGGWDNLATLLKQGISAVKAASPTTLIMLHNAEGGKNAHFRTWHDNAQARGVQWDVTGMSYYSYWHGTFTAVQTNLNDMAARYGKPVVVVETSYPFTLVSEDSHEDVINDAATETTAGYPATPAGQAANLRDIMNIVRAVPNGMGWGIFYWEPAWTAVPGSGWTPEDPNQGNAWENQAVFDYDSKPLPAMSEYAAAQAFIVPATSVSVAQTNGVYGGSSSLSATVTSVGVNLGGKSVSFMLNGTPIGRATTDANGVATLANVSLAGINAGTYADAVNVSFDGDGAYKTSSATGSLVISKADQTITFPVIPDKTYGEPDFTISASVSSGLSASFAANGPCTVTGTTVHLTGAGSCTITASQAGDTNFNPASEVAQTFNIVEATPTPTETATTVPTAVPTETATTIPTETATTVPTAVPTETATTIPTETATTVPTAVPTETATTIPTAVPTNTATTIPTETATTIPTAVPTETATTVPTNTATTIPTAVPTETATTVPTAVPTNMATTIPTTVPTNTATTIPTTAPTNTATTIPTAVPTAVPTTIPTAIPTNTAPPVPTAVPTNTATTVPTGTATTIPTALPSDTVTTVPTNTATTIPTTLPSDTATTVPTVVPTNTATVTAPTDQVSTTVDPISGGTLESGDGRVQVTVPANAVSEALTLVYTEQQAPQQPLPAGSSLVSVFSLQAQRADGSSLTQLAQPYTLVVSYNDEPMQVQEQEDSDMNVVYWNGSAWASLLPCDGCSHDPVANQITIVTNQLAEFALVRGQAVAPRYTIMLPLVVR